MPGTIEFSESFETGPNAASITNANTGWTTVTGIGGSTAKFDNTNGSADGVLSAKLTQLGSGTISLSHTLSSNQNTVFLRFAVYIVSSPPNNITLDFITPVSGSTSSIVLNQTGTMALSGAGTNSTVSTYPLNTWFLVEHSANATTTLQTLRLYSGLTGSPLETITAASPASPATTVGVEAHATASVGSLWVDAYADAFDDWVGPPGATPNNVLMWVKS